MRLSLYVLTFFCLFFPKTAISVRTAELTRDEKRILTNFVRDYPAHIFYESRDFVRETLHNRCLILTGRNGEAREEFQQLQHEFFGNLSQLTFLKKLSLVDVYFNDMPRGIYNLKKLNTLTLINNKLRRLSPRIAELKFLTNLTLVKNNLTELPDEIGELTELRTLSLKSNRLSFLPSSIGNFRKLQHLNLEFNELQGLPEETENLWNLRVLTLSGNPLLILPSCLGNLRKVWIVTKETTLLPFGDQQGWGIHELQTTLGERFVGDTDS